MTSLPVADQLARAIVAIETRGAADAPRLAAAIEGAITRLRELVSPLVGAVGIDVLLVRAMHLCRGQAWLDTIVSSTRQPPAPAALVAVIEREGAGPVKDATEMLLTQVIDLLCQFIGEDMTVRLVRTVWTDLPTADVRPEEEA